MDLVGNSFSEYLNNTVPLTSGLTVSDETSADIQIVVLHVNASCLSGSLHIFPLSLVLDVQLYAKKFNYGLFVLITLDTALPGVWRTSSQLGGLHCWAQESRNLSRVSCYRGCRKGWNLFAHWYFAGVG